METQRTANTHLLARDRSPVLPGSGHLAPFGGFSLDLAPWLLSLVHLPLCFLVLSGLGPGSSGSGCLGRVACCAAAPGGWPFWRPRGLAPCPLPLCSCTSLARAFSPPFLAPCPRGLGSCLAATTCAGSQPRSPRSPSSRSPSRLASPGLWAAPAPTVPLFLPLPLHLSRRLRQRPQRHGEGGPVRLMQRPSCGLQELAPVLALLRRCRSELRGAAPALPPSLLVAPSPSLSRDWSRAWPSQAAHQSLQLSSHAPRRRLRALLVLPTLFLAPLHVRLGLLWFPSQLLSPTLTATGTPSLTPTASPRLPRLLQPPSPSRLLPLVLVGVLATSAAVACARPLSAPCGAKSERLLRSPLVLSSGFWQQVALLDVRLARVAFWFA